MTLDDVIPEDAIFEILKKVIIEQNITNPKIHIQPGSKLGEGFQSADSAATIEGDNKSLSVFLKVAPKALELRKVLAARDHFVREIHFYDKVVPTFTKQWKTAESIFEVVPKCYLTSVEDCKEYLVLENLTNSGFILKKGACLLDEAHILLVLKKLASFHASSFVLKAENGKLFDEMSQNLPSLWYSLFDSLNFWGKFEDLCNAVAGYLIPGEDKEVIEVLDKFKRNFGNFFLNLDNYADEFSILVHSDVWVNNLMFKYKKNDVVEDVRLLDFQMYTFNTPIIDLSQFLYTCAFTKDHLKNQQYYLDYYYTCLSTELRKFSCDSSKLFPFEMFMDHWKKYCIFGVYLSVGIFRILLSGDDEVIDVAGTVNSGQDAIESVSVNFKRQEEFARMIIGLMRHVVQRQYL